MQKVWGLIVVAVLVSGCTSIKSESNNSVAVALGGADTTHTKVDTRQETCVYPTRGKVIKAINKIN